MRCRQGHKINCLFTSWTANLHQNRINRTAKKQHFVIGEDFDLSLSEPFLFKAPSEYSGTVGMIMWLSSSSNPADFGQNFVRTTVGR